MIVLMNIL